MVGVVGGAKSKKCDLPPSNFFLLRHHKKFQPSSSKRSKVIHERSLPRDTHTDTQTDRQTTSAMSNYSPPRNCKFRRGQKLSFFIREDILLYHTCMEEIKLSAEKSFSLGGLQNSHLRICNILICISTFCNF